MVYLVYGKDTFRSRQKLKEIVDFFRTKISSLGIFKVEGEGFYSSNFEELIKAQTLFEKKYVVVCSELLQNASAKIFIEKNIEKISASQNVFIFWEEEVDVKNLELFEKNSQKIQEFKFLTGVGLKKWVQETAKEIPTIAQEEIINSCGADLWCASKEIEKYSLSGESLVSTKKAEKYNPFAICDAVAKKNKKDAWLLLQQALMQGVPAEEIFYKVVWQIKSLLLVKKTQEGGSKNLQKETGLHPFVIKKTLSALQNFTEEELNQNSFKLVELYHNVRKGIEEFPIGLEKFLLGL